MLRSGVLVNVEADSLNAAVLGPDAAPGTPEFDLFIKEVATEMTVKAGQKCTAIRRAIVPTANREKATVKVRIRFNKKDPRILPDMAVKVNFLRDAKANGAAEATAAN